MDLGIKDKVALITAASQGLGKAVAWRLSMEGARVIICSRSLDNLKRTADEIAADTGGNVRTITCDVTDENQVKGMMDDIIGEFGRLDILVCNAGGPPAGTAEDFELDDYRKALELNLLSTIHLCNLTVPQMKKHKWGRIIGMT
jgi:3-oxoacyl-[acyl-carrier protein] reductase